MYKQTKIKTTNLAFIYAIFFISIKYNFFLNFHSLHIWGMLPIEHN